MRPGQRTDLAILCAWGFCTVAALFIGRTVRDTLFLAHEGPESLPVMYIVSPLAATLVGLLYGRIAEWVQRRTLVPVTALAFALALTSIRLAMGPRAIYYVLYALMDTAGVLLMMNFWLAVGERFSSREAKRVYGIVAAGGTAANIVIGLAMTSLVGVFGTENLLFGAVGFVVAIAVLAAVMARRPAAISASKPIRLAVDAGPQPGTRHLRLLGPLVVIMVVGLTLFDFQFKSIATAELAGDREAMVQFFSLLYVGTGTAALVIQLGLTGRILARLGVAAALLLLPSALVFGGIALLIAPTLISATACKAAEATLRYTANDAGMQLLYMPVPAGVRARWKARLDAVVKPATEASVGVGLLVYRSVSGARDPLLYAGIGLVLVWIVLVVRMRTAYALALRDTLRRRRMDLVPDAPSDMLGVDLSHTQPREVDVSMVQEMLADPVRATRRRGLDLARELGDPALVDTLIVCLGDRHDARHAARALAAIGPEVQTALLAVTKSDDQTSAGAITAIALACPDATGLIAAATKSRRELVRDAAAHSLAEIRRARPDVVLNVPLLVESINAELGIAFSAMAAANGLGRIESVMLPDGRFAPVPFQPREADGPAALISRALRERAERARERVFDLIAAIEPVLDVPTIRMNLRDADPGRRANAVEALDASTWPASISELKPLVLALIDEVSRDVKLAAVSKRLGLPRRTYDAWLELLLDDKSPWMRTCAAYLAGAKRDATTSTKLAALTADPDPMVAETARHALARIERREEPTMLSTAEKVLFLKGADLFAAVSSEDLAEIAAIAEEVPIQAGVQIFGSGEPGDSLYLVVEGKVRISHGNRVVAELGTREVFGEMALLDPAPRSATAMSTEPTTLLRLDQDAFTDVLTERSEVAVAIVRVLTRRLRAATTGQADPA